MQKLAKKLTIKLAKHDDQPCLHIELDLPTLSIENRLISHNIMVSIVPPAKWFLYAQSTNQNYDLNFDVRNTKLMKNLLKALRAKSDYFRFCIEENGNICFKITSDYVDISTFFLDSDIQLNYRNKDLMDTEVYANLNIRRFLAFLDCGSSVLGHLKFYIWSQKALKIESQCDGLLFHYTIKGVME